MNIIQAIFGRKGEKEDDKSVGIGDNGGMENEEEFELKPGMDTGVLIKEPEPKAWIAGAETGATYEVLEADGQYDKYLPDEEPQSFYDKVRFDTQSCVTFSGTNNLETLLNRLRAKKLLSAKAEAFLLNNGYINPQTNKVNFSDRFSAKMSGTTQNGNYLEAVGESFRNDGLVPESAWPMPDWDQLKGKSQDEVWAIYMAEIPASVKALGQKFREVFKVNYQWANATGISKPDMIRSFLPYGPFQIAAMVCAPWNSTEGMPPIQACGCGAGHGTLIYGYDKDQSWKLYDSYRSFKKLLAADYCIPWAFQYLIKEQAASTDLPLNHVFTKQLTYKDAESVEVRALQKALQTVKSNSGKPYMSPGVFGPFGPQTKAALGSFQTEHGITDPSGQGTNFGPQTRSALNAALKAIS